MSDYDRQGTVQKGNVSLVNGHSRLLLELTGYQGRTNLPDLPPIYTTGQRLPPYIPLHCIISTDFISFLT